MVVHSVEALPAMEVAERLGRLRDMLSGHGCAAAALGGDAPSGAGLDALVVTSLTNVAYLSGFSGSAGMLLVLPGENVLVTDGRYATQSEEQLRGAGVDARVEVAPAAKQAELCASLVRAARVRRLGAEAEHLSWARQRAFASEWFPGVELRATSGLVEQLRRVKDRGELARMEAAAGVGDEALAAVAGVIASASSASSASGPTEAAFAGALDAHMRDLGASAPAFETIVASGPNSALPHHRPCARVLREGEPVVVDFGARVGGYCSDMTRTLWAGELSDPVMRRVAAVVAESQQVGVDAVRAGVEVAKVDRACRAVIEAAGWGERFVHGTGHGVGLDIHEAPSLAATSGDVLEEGQVVTVEPGIYLPRTGGVRIEDTVVVTAGGCRPLTRTAK